MAQQEPGSLVSDADHLRLGRLVTELLWRVDQGHADSVHELFVAGGEMVLGPTRLSGSESLRTWGRERVASGRMSRHVVTNMRFVAGGAGEAEGARGVATVTVHLGGAAVPVSVGEDSYRFARTAGGWRFGLRAYTELFAPPVS